MQSSKVPLSEAIPFYTKQGFYLDFHTLEYVLDLKDKICHDSFLGTVKKSAPSFVENFRKAIKRAKEREKIQTPLQFMSRYKPKDKEGPSTPSKRLSCNL